MTNATPKTRGKGVTHLQGNQPVPFRTDAMKLSQWRAIVGVSRTSTYRWIKMGWLKASIEINGLLFVTVEDDRAFWEKAKSGALSLEIRGIAAAQKEAA